MLPPPPEEDGPEEPPSSCADLPMAWGAAPPALGLNCAPHEAVSAAPIAMAIKARSLAKALLHRRKRVIAVRVRRA